MLPIKLHHERLGACELLRVEGTLWVVRRLESGEFYRIPSERRREFKLDPAPSPASDGRQNAIGTGTRPENKAGEPSTQSTNAAPALLSATRPEVAAPQRRSVVPSIAPSVTELPTPGARSGAPGASDGQKTGSEIHPSQTFVVSAVETHGEDPRRLRRAFESFGTLINLDLPWNPTRLEQRKGRIQRIGQLNDTVYIYNMRYLGSVEDRVHQLLSARLQGIFTLFGQVPDVLEDVWIDIAIGEVEQAKKVIEAVPTRHPFDIRYQKIERIDWESCERVLSASAKREALRRGWQA